MKRKTDSVRNSFAFASEMEGGFAKKHSLLKTADYLLAIQWVTVDSNNHRQDDQKGEFHCSRVDKRLRLTLLTESLVYISPFVSRTDSWYFASFLCLSLSLTVCLSRHQGFNGMNRHDAATLKISVLRQNRKNDSKAQYLPRVRDNEREDWHESAAYSQTINRNEVSTIKTSLDKKQTTWITLLLPEWSSNNWWKILRGFEVNEINCVLCFYWTSQLLLNALM